MASKNKADAIMSGAGWLMQFTSQMTRALKKQGWDNERIHQLATESGEEDVECGVRAFVEALTSFFNPDEFFVTREGLHVWNEFTERILSVCRPTKLVSDVKLKHFDLSRDMTDSEIRSELGEGHVYTDASEFCSVLAGKLQKQWNGKNGELLVNGYANIFYVTGKNGEVFAVRVRWDSDDRRWRVFANRLGGDRWIAGSRAFSAKDLKKAA